MPRIVHRYLSETTFDDVEPLEYWKGEPLAVMQEEMLEEEKIEDNEPRPLK